MPYDFEDDPLSEAEQRQRLKGVQAEQARTLRQGLGDDLYDWAEAFLDDMNFLVED